MRFKYAAKTKDGLKSQQGEIEAPNERAAIKMLRSKNLVVYSLKTVKESGDVMAFLNSFMRIPLGEKVKFTDQLASMISAGLPLTKALSLEVTQIKNQRMQKIAENALSDVESGVPLSTSLQKQGAEFNNSYISLIKAGEASGKLDQVLRRLADTMEKQRQFNSKVKSAMLYPAIITLAMIGVFFVIVVFVVPQMTDVYESFDVDLPITTKALIWLSDFLTSLTFLITAPVLIIGSILAFRAVKANKEGERLLARLSMKLPIFGALVTQSGVVEFTRTLGLLIESGVPFVQGLEIVKDSMTNAIYRDAAILYIEDVKHGTPLSESIGRVGVFPDFVSQMLVVGEETGTVDKQLNNMANYYEGEVDKVVKNLSTALEPIIMIMLGIMVGVLIFSVITPIYQLTSEF